MFYSKCIHKRKLESHNQKTLSLGNKWLLILVLSFVSPLLPPSHFYEIINSSLLKLQFLPTLLLSCPLFTQSPWYPLSVLLPTYSLHTPNKGCSGLSINQDHTSPSHFQNMSPLHIGPISGKRTGFSQVQVLWPFSVFHHASRLNSLH